jgi:hypothetical protein
MSANTLNNRASGQTITADFFNDIHSALDGDFVGRGATGIPTAGQNLGTVALPWGNVYASAMTIGGTAIDTSKIVSPANRVVSGKKRSTSNQPAFITPNGAAASFIIAGATTPLVLNINSIAVSVSTDLTKSGLTVAPSSNNTCLVNDTTAAGQAETKIWGEYWSRKAITIDTVGSGISGLVGKYAAFKTGTEYFIALVETSTKLSRAYRGFFYNSSLAPLNRVALTDNDVITLMSLAWIFVSNDGTTVDVTYNNPVWAVTSPSSPATGDYWYDLANNTWKRYDGASFQIISRTFVGWAVLDSTNCVAARCEHVYADFDNHHELTLEISSTSVVQQASPYASISVYGSLIEYKQSITQWNMTTNLAAAADMYSSTEQASTMYYLYVKDTGEKVISDISPYYRPDFRGWYHPHNPWRCAGLAYNDGSSNIISAGGPNDENRHHWSTTNAQGATDTKIEKFSVNSFLTGCDFISANTANNGTIWTCYMPCYADFSGFVYANAASILGGLSLNSSALTTDFSALAITDKLDDVEGAAAGGTTMVGKYAYAGLFKIGDKVRLHFSTSGFPADNANAFMNCNRLRSVLK